MKKDYSIILIQLLIQLPGQLLSKIEIPMKSLLEKHEPELV
jgi:hypothetical protein